MSMAKRRKSARMFTREDRRARREQTVAEARRLGPEELARRADVQTILIHTSLSGDAESPRLLAEMWVGTLEEINHSNGEPWEGDLALRDACARQFKRLTGEDLITDLAEGYLEDPRDLL